MKTLSDSIARRVPSFCLASPEGRLESGAASPTVGTH